jgi:hypothetical protein
MQSQIAVVERRNGHAAARDYAVRTLRAYRSAARFRDGVGRRHFAHDAVYRRVFVRAMCEIRHYLRRDSYTSPISTRSQDAARTALHKIE